VIVQVEMSNGSTLAQQLSERLEAPLVEISSPWLANSVRLRYQHGALQAVAMDPAGVQMVVNADFLQTSSTRRRQQAQSELLIKAVQGRQRQPLTILDATAGMVADSMLMASRGHKVLALEQSHVVYELVQDGLKRAASAGVLRLPTLLRAEAGGWLADHAERKFDVIYLDPMFVKSGKRALPRKNMQLLRHLSDGASGGESLLSLAITRAQLRVVVKRPSKGDWLGKAPEYSIKGQRVRFDIYQGG